MSRRRSIVGALLVSAALGLGGCFGTETGNPPYAPTVGSETGVPMGVLPELSITEGWLALDGLGFEAGADCAAVGDATVVRAAPFALPLVGAQRVETDPVLEEGDYCALSFSRVAWTEAEPAILGGVTLAIDATLADDTPVRIRSGALGGLRLVASAPFAMSPESGGLVIYVDESLLFNGIRWVDVRRDADGTIVLDESTNADLLARIEGQLPGALAVYRDTDGDGRASAAERAAGALATVAP